MKLRTEHIKKYKNGWTEARINEAGNEEWNQWRKKKKDSSRDKRIREKRREREKIKETEGEGVRASGKLKQHDEWVKGRDSAPNGQGEEERGRRWRWIRDEEDESKDVMRGEEGRWEENGRTDKLTDRRMGQMNGMKEREVGEEGKDGKWG